MQQEEGWRLLLQLQWLLRNMIMKQILSKNAVKAGCGVAKRDSRSLSAGKNRTRQIHQGWKVALAGAGVNFLGGITYAWSIFARGLTEELGWAQAQTSLPYTVFVVSYSLFMVLAGRLQDRVGPTRVVAAGGLLVGGAFLLSSMFLTPLGVALIWGLLFGLGMACCFASVTPAAIKWFPPSQRGLVTGIVVTGIGVSALVLSPALNYFIQFGVARTFRGTGIILLAGILFLSRYIKNPPGDKGKEPAGETTQDWCTVLRTPHFYILWTMFFIATGIGLTFTAHMHSIAFVQASLQGGFLFVTIFSFFNATGRIVAGFLSDRLGRSRAMTVVFMAMSFSVVLLLLTRTPLQMGLAAMSIGLSYGSLFSLFPAASATYFGVKNFGFNYGLVFTGLGAGGLFPLLAGFLFDRYGDFRLVFSLFLLLSLLLVALSLYLSRREQGIPQGVSK